MNYKEEILIGELKEYNAKFFHPSNKGRLHCIGIIMAGIIFIQQIATKLVQLHLVKLETMVIKVKELLVIVFQVDEQVSCLCIDIIIPELLIIFIQQMLTKLEHVLPVKLANMVIKVKVSHVMYIQQ